MSKKRLTKLAVLTVAVLLGCGGLELMARLFFDSHGKHYGIEMWKYAKQLKQISSNDKMGHEHRPDSKATLMGVPVSINSIGLRDQEYSMSKPEDTYRILVLGDSMTFGWGARIEDSYSEVLERRLNDMAGRPGMPLRFEVINAGVGNYNSVQEVAYFESRGLQLDPDMVVLGFFLNDAEPMPVSKRSWLREHSYLFVLGASLTDSLARRMGQRKTLVEYYSDLYREEPPEWIACRTALLRLVRLCGENEVNLTVLSIPELHSPKRDYPFQFVDEQLHAVFDPAGIQVVDPRPAIPDVAPEELWVTLGDAHPSAVAHRAFADSLFEVIAKRFRRDVPDENK